MPTARRRYPSDLTDAEGAIRAPVLPPAKPGGRPRSTDLREILTAIRYWLRGGVGWHALPHDFPAWQTVYHSWRSGRLRGDWERIHPQLRAHLRRIAGRAPTPSAGILQSQAVKTTARGGRPSRRALLAAHR